MPFIVATYVYASSQRQRTHSARTNSHLLLVFTGESASQDQQLVVPYTVLNTAQADCGLIRLHCTLFWWQKKGSLAKQSFKVPYTLSFISPGCQQFVHIILENL